ncbi:hypothetical protein SCLCIDRAFT_25605 [Scleroderma citrinum Foug A]|uniref:Uncharacterized protein n=1 Tax=Scleroderma citrinum Foug A TaxID=1036808 RepID=A0A0C3AA55_9AGAM|nr:hypothetical protein SCLCIDRAFT_25605 [Scleroderma citrinum Foug A]
MSSDNITDSSNNSSTNSANKIDWQRVTLPNLIEEVDDLLELMKWVAEQEVQQKAEEKAKRVAKEEVRRLAKEEAKKKAKEHTQKRAEFQVLWQADLERKAREKAKAKVAMEAMRALIAQKVGQGEKPKSKQHWVASQHAPNEEVKGWYPPCDRCQRSGDSKACALASNVRMLTCNQCQKMKVKCYLEVSMVTMKRLASGEKHKESEALPTMVTMSP